MKYFIIMLLLVFSLYAYGPNIEHYNASKNNELLCRDTSNSYIKVSQKNSSIVTINTTKFFKLNNKNKYITTSGCHIISKHGSGIIF